MKRRKSKSTLIPDEFDPETGKSYLVMEINEDAVKKAVKDKHYFMEYDAENNKYVLKREV
jgi:hypothetical protein